MQRLTTSLFAIAFALGANVSSAHADTVSYYVGVDGSSNLTSGTYSGLANPNAGRLTLLFNHGDHFHGIGAYSYSGSASAATVTSTNTNNRLPEISSAEPPLPLTPGTGMYNGRLVNEAGESEYSHIEMESFNALAGAAPGSAESVLFNSSSGRWSGSIGNATIGLELVSATPGLTVGDGSQANLFASTTTTTLGSGAGFQFTPVFSTAADAAVGVYSATFRLVDLTSVLQPSGQFTLDFQTTPEPGSIMLLPIGLVAVGYAAKRQRFKAKRSMTGETAR